MSLEQALVRRNEELEEKNLVLEDRVAALEETLDSQIEAPGYLGPVQSNLFRSIPLAPRVITRSALMTRVYGHLVSPPDEKTMDVHIHQMRRKFASRQAPFWLQTVWGIGYALHSVDEAFWQRVGGIKPSLLSHRSPEEIDSELLGITPASVLATDRRAPILPSHNQPSS